MPVQNENEWSLAECIRVLSQSVSLSHMSYKCYSQFFKIYSGEEGGIEVGTANDHNLNKIIRE